MRRFFEHTGDVGVRLSGATLEDLFREAALSLLETLTDPESVRAAAGHSVELNAATLDDLMVVWLDELLYRFEVRNVLIVDVEVTIARAGNGWHLEGTLCGEPFDQSRHAINVLIKGVTYHQLNVRREGEAWCTDLVFDI